MYQFKIFLLNKSLDRFTDFEAKLMLLLGILVAKKKLLSSKTPHSCGGGTVFFVTPTDHRYFKEEEMREEGGTPAILGSIRAGLAVQLKEAVGTEWIMAREEELCRRVFREWEPVSELVVIGPHSIPRLPVFSFLIRHPATGRFLHHNYVCTLLNDLFGIQVRGGCSCAGPYAQVGSCLAHDL
jgi:selenocysteine lyase/cysteine desulfurase